MSTKQTKKSNSPKGAFARSLAKKDCSKSCKAYLYPEDAYIEPAGTVGTAFSEDGKLYLCLRYRASDDKKPVEFCPAHNLWVPETDSQATLERRNFTESTHNGIHHKKGNVCYLIKQKGKAVWGVYSDPELLRNLAAAFPDEEEQAEQEEEVPTGPGSKMEESDQEKEKEEEEIRTEEDSDPDGILCTIRTTVKPTGPAPLVDLTGGSGSIKWAAPHVDEEIQSQGDLESQGLEDEELQRRGEEELRLLEHEEHLRAEQEAQEYEEHQKREAEELQRKEEEERQRREEMEHQRQEDEERQRELEFQKEREKLLENPEEKAPEVTNEKAEEETASAPVDPAPARKPIISTSYHYMDEPIVISIPARPKKAPRKRKTPTASKDAPEKEDAPVAKGKRSRKATKFYGRDQEK